MPRRQCAAMRAYRHHSLLPNGEPGSVPEWLHLVPAGTFSGADGRGPYKLGDAAAVIAASMAGGKVPLDENHSTDLAGPAGHPSPARGWIVDMQGRDDGIWGRVEWCDSGRQLMADRAYRGISPVFTTDAKGDVRQVLRASLTNTPNLGDLHTLHSEDINVDLIASLRTALGLAATADEAAIVTAAEAAHASASRHSAAIAAIAAAAGAPGTDAATLVTALQTQRATANDTQLMANKIVGLETELQTMKAAAATSHATTFVDAQIKAGKPIASLREHFIARHAADPAAVEKELAALPSIHAGGMPPRAGMHADGEDGLSQEEMSTCHKMGLDPKKFAEQKKKAGAKGMK